MLRGKRFLTLLSIIMVFSLLLIGCTSNQTVSGVDYPEKPINVLQGFKPGGGSDTLAQLTQPYLEKILGQTFVNQYMPGATGAIAWTELCKKSKRAAPLPP